MGKRQGYLFSLPLFTTVLCTGDPSPSVGSLAAPRGLLGSRPPQPTLTPQLLPTPEGPVPAIRELGGAECSGLRVVGAPPQHPVCAPLLSSRSSRGCGEHVYTAGTHRTAPKHRPARKPRSPGGRPGWTSDHFPLSVPLASSAPRITPPREGL